MYNEILEVIETANQLADATIKGEMTIDKMFEQMIVRVENMRDFHIAVFLAVIKAKMTNSKNGFLATDFNNRWYSIPHTNEHFAKILYKIAYYVL